MRTLVLAALAAATALVGVTDTSLDEAMVKPGALAGFRALLVDPPTASYARRPAPSDPIYRKDEDWQFRPGDLEILGKALREALRDALAERGIEVVDRPGAGVLRLTPELVDVRLTAPLHEDSSVRKTLVKSIGDIGLRATLRDAASGETIATIRDMRRNVQVSTAPVEGVRFTSTLYLFEVKRIFRRWAEQTAALFPESKTP